MYGQSSPPDYNLTNINIPIALFTGSNDWLADNDDVNHLKKVLPSNIIIIDNNEDDMAHLDFVWGIGSSIQGSTYGKVIKLLSEYNNNY